MEDTQLCQQTSMSMQSLLHSPEGEHDIYSQPDPLLPNTTYPPISMGDDKFESWAYTQPNPSRLEEQVQTLSELRLPEDTTDNTSPLARFMTDTSSSRPLVGIDNTGFIPAHNTHLSIATSWTGSHYAPSAVSSYEYSYSPGRATSTGSPDEQQFHDINYDAPPGYQRRDSGGHSQRSSIDGIPGFSPSSPALSPGEHWRRRSEYSIDSSTDQSNLSPHSHRNSQDSFVSPKDLCKYSPLENENDGEDFTGRLHSNGIPGIYVNGQEHSDNEHDSPCWQPLPFWNLDAMDTSCTSPTSKVSPSSPRAATRLEERRERRRSRSGSGASQFSNKARTSDMMKPHPDAVTNANGKNHKGRGAGKKTKERQICPEHPTKTFRHNSDFRKHMQNKHTRPFICTFHFAGCEQTFGSKNEWKRHVFSQHLQLHYWRCDYPDCADRKAFFNRKDLFGQHLKRMHGPKTNTSSNSTNEMKNWLGKEIPQIQDRCRKERRAPPGTSKCGYCPKEFSGRGSWDVRMEHVGKHYEKNNYKQIDTNTWVMDGSLINWAINEGIVEKTPEGGYKLLCHGKDSIEGEERRRSSQLYGAPLTEITGNEADCDEDAEGESED